MKQIKFILFITLCSVLLFSGCKKTVAPDLTTEVEVSKASHNWYYFSPTGFNKIDKPQNTPKMHSQPWTESIRISSANSTSNSTKAFAIVNRLGVLCLENNNISLAQDSNIFNNRTAGNLVFANDTPIFSVFKSSFFNETIATPDYKEDQSAHLFLIQFDPIAKISYPLINSSSLTNLTSNSDDFSVDLPGEVIDYVWNNENWLCAIKTLEQNKTIFSYLKWKPQIPLLSISPNNAQENIIISDITSDDFRKAKSQIDYANGPKRIKELLAGFSKDLPFTLEVKTAGGGTPREYINKIDGSTEKELLGKGVLADSWSGVLFEDGTLFMEGALPGKHILREGKPVAIRLPKLPAGFVYSEFTISGTTLYAGWEESSFYKTGRSGFIQVDLEETLYSKII